MGWNVKEAREVLDMPGGEYVCEVMDVLEKQSMSSGAEMWTVMFKTLSPKSDMTLFDNFVKEHPVAQRRFLMLAKAAGVLEKDEIEPEDLIYKKVRVFVEVEDFEGLPQGRIKSYMSAKDEKKGDE